MEPVASLGRLGPYLVECALVAVNSALAGSDAVVYSVFFVLLFAWIGVAFPQGTSLLSLGLFAAAYVLPLVSLDSSR